MEKMVNRIYTVETDNTMMEVHLKTFIDKVLYDTVNRTLIVHFEGNRLYKYHNILIEDFSNLVNKGVSYFTKLKNKSNLCEKLF